MEKIKQQAEILLNHSPRFKLFTLHGTSHLNNLFGILDILIDGGLRLKEDELFYLCLAICVHDLGMVVGLSGKDLDYLFQGKPVASDPAIIEEAIREHHHEIVDIYFSKNIGLLSGLGLTPSDLSIVEGISRCHRKIVLQEQHGMIKKLGALIRMVDELDVGPSRAPIQILLNQIDEMDQTSAWHWYKHNITEAWIIGHNVEFGEIHGRKKIRFRLRVHPSSHDAVSYWLHQTRRPISRALDDSGCREIIRESFGLDIEVTEELVESTPVSAGSELQRLEKIATSSNRKTILLIDDESRKMEDLFLQLSFNYNIIYAHSAKDALDKIGANQVDLALVDMQISGHGLWTPSETNDYKATGMKLLELLKAEHPSIKRCLFTGTRYDISESAASLAQKIMRKPFDPDKFSLEIEGMLHD